MINKKKKKKARRTFDVCIFHLAGFRKLNVWVGAEALDNKACNQTDWSAAAAVPSSVRRGEIFKRALN